MEALKRVIYTMEGEETVSLFEAADEREREKLEEIQKEREGLFHRFGDKVIVLDGQHYAMTYGIIQDVESGEIKSVHPKRIRFV